MSDTIEGAVISGIPEEPRESASAAEPLSFSAAFHYPFNRAVGLLNILWILIPIFGWFAIMGYSFRIIREFSLGQFKELPPFHFWENCGHGFMILLKMIPFYLAYGMVVAVGSVLTLGIGGVLLASIIGLFAIPLLTVNFCKKGTVASHFEFSILSVVFPNIVDYIVALLKDIALAIVFIFMCIILVGFPAGAFTKSIFIADFYRRHVR